MARKKRLDTLSVLDCTKSSIAISWDDDIQTFTGLYARLSVEDSGKSDGDSLENQIELLKGYVDEHPELLPYKLYIDNGESGVEYQRTAFIDMMQDIKDGIVRCVVVKDLSRLGRNYLETGKYLEEVFPVYGVRFISVVDKFDSLDANVLDESVIVPLKNMMNEGYAKDISKKITGTFKIMQKQGKFLGNYPPYGYKKDPNNKGHLIIDEKVADNVRQIFLWKAEGISYGEIARRLNEDGILAPFRYFYSIGILKTEKHKNSLWTRTIVKKLLCKRAYIGDMVSGKEQTSLVLGIKKKAMSEEEWVIVEGTHAPIVNRELFWKVQELMNDIEKQYKDMERHNDYKVENLFRGKIYCAECGSAMKIYKAIKKGRNGNEYKVAKYICGHYAEHKGASYVNDNCKRVGIDKKELDGAVADTLRYHMKAFINMNEVLTVMNQLPKSKTIYGSLEQNIEKMRARINKIENISSNMYEDFREGILSEAEYLQYRKKYASERTQLNTEIDKAIEEKKYYEPQQRVFKNQIDIIKSWMNFNELSKEIVDAFIEKIVIYKDKRIKITFTFKDVFEEILTEVSKRKEEIA